MAHRVCVFLVHVDAIVVSHLPTIAPVLRCVTLQIVVTVLARVRVDGVNVQLRIFHTMAWFVLPHAITTLVVNRTSSVR